MIQTHNLRAQNVPILVQNLIIGSTNQVPSKIKHPHELKERMQVQNKT